MRRAVLLLLALALTACQDGDRQSSVWFVHATDPHVFVGEEDKDADARKVRLYQERLDQETFSGFIDQLDDPPGGPKPTFLVVTGDFGLDRFAPRQQQQPPASAAPTQPAAEPPAASPPASPPIPAPAPEPAASDSAESAVKYLVDALGKSPVKDIYLVPGNNDVGGEAAEGENVAATQALWGRVRQGIAGAGVRVHDLTTCYFGTKIPSGCHADVAGTPYRLIGFPSQSFKNEKGTIVDRTEVQMAQLEKLAGLVSEAARQKRRVLIVTHIPEVDDPHILAQNEMALRRELMPPEKRAAQSLDRPEWAAASPWNMRKVAFDKWKGIVDDLAVAGVLAGHFHDSHKEIYRQPYDWATVSAERASLDKLYLVPPLSMRLQDESPIQARGFALFGLKQGDDDPERLLFWYDRKAKTFEREEPARRVRTEASTSLGRRVAGTFGMYWKLATEPLDLARAAVIAIAFLAAFLTIVELWEIPPPKTPLAPGTAQPGSVTAPARDFSAFQSNFVKTVLAGLGGMLVLTFLESIWSDKGINARAYYVVLFITFFFLLLLLYALCQALIEGLRSRIFTQHPVRAWRPITPRDGSGGTKGDNPPPKKGAGRWTEAGFRFSHLRVRTWDWILSLRSFFLIVFDTFSNVLRGRNQLRTVVFEKAITDLHWGIVRAADRIREEIERAILNSDELKNTAVDDDIRVSVSMLSEDESVLFYVAREQGSLARSFDKRSVAWVSTYTDTALWWEKDYPADTELLDNTSGGHPLLPAEKLLLGTYFQARPGQDYGAFLVLPVPWAKRSAADTHRKACIQISFRSKKMMDDLFLLPEDAQGRPYYSRWHSLLDDREPNHELEPECPWLRDAQLRNVLRHSLLLLEDLLTPFNETVFDMYVRPHLRAR